ncbi:hypothetical protein DEO72_LG8g2389 [Vigna unguiculata]|uniref:Uncharacterized protein n=1 Tax=Vigna unguiculata TaxID=3917 RepID=A0A4D6MSI9_VIGUN|nr:hypothetical protein DEO72_LG8g2389 [Vigna unguiculata]
MRTFLYNRLNNDPGWKTIKGDVEPRLRTLEGIIAAYRKTGYLYFNIHICTSRILQILVPNGTIVLNGTKVNISWLTGMLYLADELLDASISDISVHTCIRIFFWMKLLL